MTYTATRYHDICAGHRVFGHENKCAHLHGHNYRIWFHCRGKLDSVGRVIDFSRMKEYLCLWLEDNWDHRFLIWERDSDSEALIRLDGWVVLVPFNPTAENMAQYLVEVIGPQQLGSLPIELFKVVVEETPKCHASFELPAPYVIDARTQGKSYDDIRGPQVNLGAIGGPIDD